MQINASTYETFFLLYIDNELSAKERLEVDAFIAENPSYALLMEELKATVIEQEAIPFSLKAQLKQIPANEIIEMEELEAIWNQSFKNDIAEDLQAIKGLSNDFKESLKKNKKSKGVLIRPFGFNQNKFTYAAVAALLMVFFGYQQMTKTTELNTTTATVSIATTSKKEPDLSKATAKTVTKENGIVSTANQPVQSKTQVTKTSEAQIAIAPQMEMIVKESIVLNESTNAQKQLNSTNIVADIQLSSDLNSAATNTSISINTDNETITEEKAAISYEVIDTEDPNRTIYIANFEIDGNRLRGLKRKVNSLFKANKSDRNK